MTDETRRVTRDVDAASLTDFDAMWSLFGAELVEWHRSIGGPVKRILDHWKPLLRAAIRAEGGTLDDVIFVEAVRRHGDPHAYRSDLCRCGRFNCEIRAAVLARLAGAER